MAEESFPKNEVSELAASAEVVIETGATVTATEIKAANSGLASAKIEVDSALATASNTAVETTVQQGKALNKEQNQPSKEVLTGLNKVVQEEVVNGKTVDEVIEAGLKQANTMPETTQKSFSDYVSKLFNTFKTSFLDAVTAADGKPASEAVSDKMDTLKDASSKLQTTNSDPKATEAEKQQAQTDFDKAQSDLEQTIQEKAPKTKEKADSKDSTSWDKMVSILKLGALLGTIAGVVSLIALYCKEHTGCYIYIAGKRTKLEGCSDWYGKNKANCACGATTKADPSNRNPNCSTLITAGSDECKAPYCLGKSCGTAGAGSGEPVCAFPPGGPRLCTTNPDLTADGSVAYAYHTATPLEAIASIPKYVSNLAKDMLGDIGDMLKSILKWVLIAVVIGIGLFILFAVVKVILAKYSHSSESGHNQQSSHSKFRFC